MPKMLLRSIINNIIYLTAIRDPELRKDNVVRGTWNGRRYEITISIKLIDKE